MESSGAAGKIPRVDRVAQCGGTDVVTQQPLHPGEMVFDAVCTIVQGRHPDAKSLENPLQGRVLPTVERTLVYRHVPSSVCGRKEGIIMMLSTLSTLSMLPLGARRHEDVLALNRDYGYGVYIRYGLRNSR